MSVIDWVSTRLFDLVHRHNLVYNTCWEDPRLDRQALDLGPEETVLVITSAGCNALDYVLGGAGRVFAVDMNPRQNALLELKIAGIRKLEQHEFFGMFGRGYLPDVKRIYRTRLRDSLSEEARRFWDRRIGFFGSSRRPFYFRGTSGAVARMVNFYIDRVARVRPWIDKILAARTLEEQKELYLRHVRDRFWSRSIRFLANRSSALSMVGVPEAQRAHVEEHFDGDMAAFIQGCVDAVFTKLSLSDNYFWRVYLEGHYSPDCCPEYLRPLNFARLRGGLVDLITTHTGTVQSFLESHDGSISRYVLLDHMDWLKGRRFAHLEAEWQAILDRAAPDARVIWRTGGLRTEFLDRVRVSVNGRTTALQELLRYDHGLAQKLHQSCRVGTYGAFFIARVSA